MLVSRLIQNSSVYGLAILASTRTTNSGRLVPCAAHKTTDCFQAFVHLSTAFCHPDSQELEERAYESPMDPHDVMRCVQWIDEASLDVITARYVKNISGLRAGSVLGQLVYELYC
jgi:hypothetical protein